MGGTFVFYPFDPYKDIQSDHQLDQKNVPEYSRSNGILLSGSTISLSDNDFAVTPGTGLQVKVAPGSAYIQEQVYNESNVQSLSITTNSSGSTRTDLVVLRLTLGAGTFSRQVITGSTTPVRTTTSWDLPLAEVAVPDSASSISASNLKNRRAISLSTAQVISAMISRPSSLLIPNTTNTTSIYTSANWDTHNIWNGSDSLTAPKDGFYYIWSQVDWLDTVTGRRVHSIWINKTVQNLCTFELKSANTSSQQVANTCMVYQFKKGESIQTGLFQNSGSGINVASLFMSMTYLGD